MNKELTILYPNRKERGNEIGVLLLVMLKSPFWKSNDIRRSCNVIRKYCNVVKINYNILQL